jgi:hypothetical protein
MEPAADGEWIKYENIVELETEILALKTELAALVYSVPEIPEAEVKERLRALTSEDSGEHEKVAEGKL